MILFFQSSTKTVLAVEAAHAFSPEDTQKLVWLFSEATPVQSETLEGWYVGPRREMITPWSTNAVEITQNMGLTGISRELLCQYVLKEKRAEPPGLALSCPLHSKK